jgi:hypothetical protein
MATGADPRHRELCTTMAGESGVSAPTRPHGTAGDCWQRRALALHAGRSGEHRLPLVIPEASIRKQRTLKMAACDPRSAVTPRSLLTERLPRRGTTVRQSASGVGIRCVRGEFGHRRNAARVFRNSSAKGASGEQHVAIPSTSSFVASRDRAHDSHRAQIPGVPVGQKSE